MTAPPLMGGLDCEREKLPPGLPFPGAEQEEPVNRLVRIHLPGLLDREPTEARRGVVELLEPNPRAHGDGRWRRDAHRGEESRGVARLCDHVERRLPPAEQAAVWGLVGGIPLYLEWWDDRASVRANLERLVCSPGAPLLTAGELSLATDLDAGDLAQQVVYAIAAGKTKHNEIADTIRADPTRVLERLTRIGVVERMTPVTEDPRRTRRRVYRIADNFLGFWLSVVDRHRGAMERGLGRSVLPVMMRELDDHLGGPWEEAMRIHLRRLAAAGELGEDVVAVGRYWTAAAPPVEIEGVVLAGRSRKAVAVAEAKWARRLDGTAVVRTLARKATALPRVADDLRYVVAARETVEGAGFLGVTAADVFSS